MGVRDNEALLQIIVGVEGRGEGGGRGEFEALTPSFGMADDDDGERGRLSQQGGGGGVQPGNLQDFVGGEREMWPRRGSCVVWAGNDWVDSVCRRSCFQALFVRRRRHGRGAERGGVW